VVEWTSVPLVPVIVKGKLPVGVEAVVATVKVELPDVATVAGLKDAVAPTGNPLTLRVTVPVNPPDGVTVAVYVALPPGVTVTEAGVAETA
jgi:hypothetical protein